MTPKFAIGSVVAFGNDNWTVVGYHRIGDHWEVMFRSEWSGSNHRSIPCSELEAHV